MHELTLSQGIVDVACRQAAADGAVRVRRVRIAIGALSHVDPAAIEFSFGAVARGTPVEDAILEIEQPPGRAHCLTCQVEVRVAARDLPCPRCGGHGWILVGGDELRVLELEVE
ncbi:MAG: hydrogenase maturation nickel metallochaperone HypA [Rhodospirillaceae bacterium]